MITTVTRVITKQLIRWGGWWRAGDSPDNGLSNHSTQLHSVHRCWRHSYVFWSQSAFIWVITSNLWPESPLARCPPSISFIVLLPVITISLSCRYRLGVTMGLLATNSYNHSSHRHQPPAASGLLFFPFSPVLSLALIRLCSLHKCPVFTIQTASKIL